MTNPNPRQLAEDLREAVRDYRNPGTTDAERAEIKAFFVEHGAANHVAACLHAAELEKEAGQR